MPWQGVCPMELRMRMVNALVAEEDSMTALCEEYGVSRKTGYKWLTRFRAQGAAGLAERSHAPHVVPWAVTQRRPRRYSGCGGSIRAGDRRNCAPSCWRGRRHSTGRR